MHLLFLLLTQVTVAAVPIPKCDVVLSDQSGDFKKFPLPRLTQNPTRATKTGFEYTDGFFCDEKLMTLDGRFTFQDASDEKWEIKFSVEKAEKGSRLSVVQMRGDKRYGNQFDTEYLGRPCSLLKLAHPISLIGLETKDKKWFSASVICEKAS